MALKIIGTGMSRTGTLSTKTALETLGFGPCHHMMELFANPAQVEKWVEVARCEPVAWDAVFDGYESQVDFPGGRVWQQTIHAFPDAKVLHTERPEEEWWASFQQDGVEGLGKSSASDPEHAAAYSGHLCQTHAVLHRRYIRGPAG